MLLRLDKKLLRNIMETLPMIKGMKLNILIKWLHGILTKPLTILKSIYYNIKNKHQDLAITRLDICHRCDHKLNTNFGDLCDLCGCVLDNKTRIKDEFCEQGKW